ncbi:hypothetical protein HPP92_028447 [Vanilla planifolia]|uniref:Uncharacterized protein n=1 Tax=Vanilla planifolia TaxID=51239 RepID=A0A835P7P4_VANPL|nr:hypothetical protein HPP92_028447 [Vanilla planifolia]
MMEMLILLSPLINTTNSPTAFTRATVVIAVKYSIVERPEKIDEILFHDISTFLMLIKDKDRVSFTPRLKFDLLLYAGHLDLVAFEKAMSCFSLLYLQHVRRAAVLALSTAAHNKPNLIKGLLLEMLQVFI